MLMWVCDCTSAEVEVRETCYDFSMLSIHETCIILVEFSSFLHI